MFRNVSEAFLVGYVDTALRPAQGWPQMRFLGHN